MRSWLADFHTGAEPKEVSAIPIAPSLYSLSNKMGNSLLAVRDINHKYIVVGGFVCRHKTVKFVQVNIGKDRTDKPPWCSPLSGLCNCPFSRCPALRNFQIRLIKASSFILLRRMLINT